MAGTLAPPHAGNVVDIRRALPALPLATCAGLYGTYSLANGGAPPVVSVGGGAAVLGAVIVGTYRTAAGWSERARRQVGYGTAVLLGLVTGAILAFAAFGTSLCGIWGETCTPAELAAVRRLSAAAVISVVAVPALYALIDLVTLRRR